MDERRLEVAINSVGDGYPGQGKAHGTSLMKLLKNGRSSSWAPRHGSKREHGRGYQDCKNGWHWTAD